MNIERKREKHVGQKQGRDPKWIDICSHSSHEHEAIPIPISTKNTLNLGGDWPNMVPLHFFKCVLCFLCLGLVFENLGAPNCYEKGFNTTVWGTLQN